MSVSKIITEIVIFHLTNGVNLENVEACSSNPEGAFYRATNIIKSQPGFIRQFWGHQVENPNLFVWAIDWNTFEHHTEFIDSEIYPSFLAILSHVFTFEVPSPITIYTRVANHELAIEAFRSGITEISFYTTPTRPDAQTEKEIEASSLFRDIREIGKATGAAIGWVLDGIPQDIISGSPPVSIYGVFGYPNLGVHMKWRETPEAKRYGKRSDTTLPSTLIPGIDKDTGYFHVHFREGI